MISHETVWASIGAGISAATLKLIDKWFHRNEKRLAQEQRESDTFHQDQAVEFVRLQRRVELLDTTLDQWKDKYYTEREKTVAQAAEITDLKKKLAAAEQAAAARKPHLPGH